MIKRILVGYDGSESAQRAFRFAVDLMRMCDGHVYVISVLQVTEAGSDASVLMMTDNLEEVEASLRKELHAQIPDAGDMFDIEVLYGSPGDILLSKIKDQNIDHLVIGHTERGQLIRWLLGSVSDDIIAHATVPVTVVR